MTEHRKYNIEHRKVRKTTMLYEDQLSWIQRNQPGDIKSESEFISYLLALGMQEYMRAALEQNHEAANA